MPTQVERNIVKAVKTHIAAPDFKVLLPFLSHSSWDDVLSTNHGVREGFRSVGKTALHLAFSLAFSGICGELGDEWPVGMFGMLENLLLSEEVLYEIMKKPNHPHASRIAAKGVGAVRDGVHTFIGGLWNDTGDLGKVAPWVKNTFGPLLKVAVDVYQMRPPKRARSAQAPDDAKGKSTHPTDLRALQRIYALQVAKKPFKASRALKSDKAAPPSTPSPPPSTSFESPVDRETEHELPSKAPGINGGASVAGAQLTALTAQPRRPEAPKTPTLPQAPFSLKRKIPSSPSSPHATPTIAPRNLLYPVLASSSAYPSSQSGRLDAAWPTSSLVPASTLRLFGFFGL
ncbi:hypothetical protein K438DRAFT_1869497 [Mycena galopus ATCC 62051]|nr:hypothetical protein K438DRAFT_1869497 [Mycena galopus ATCC 62051]